MNEPKLQTPLTDAEEYVAGAFSSTIKVVRSEVARSLELKLQEAKSKLEVESVREKCIVCNKFWSPSLIESSHCIFCISNGYKSQVALMTGEIELAYSRLKEAECQRDEARLAYAQIEYCKKALLSRSTIKEEQAVIAERDQLIKVVDRAVECASHIGWTSAEDIRWIRRAEKVRAEHSLLPHVQAKKFQPSTPTKP